MIFAHLKPKKLLELNYNPNKRIHKGITWELLTSYRVPDGEGSSWLSYNYHMQNMDGSIDKMQAIFSYEEMDNEGVESCAKQLIEYLFFEDDEY